jgi:hypothetical protein
MKRDSETGLQGKSCPEKIERLPLGAASQRFIKTASATMLRHIGEIMADRPGRIKKFCTNPTPHSTCSKGELSC